jgi:hypothetical protein
MSGIGANISIKYHPVIVRACLADV